jgi:hypothetical protein
LLYVSFKKRTIFVSASKEIKKPLPAEKSNTKKFFVKIENPEIQKIHYPEKQTSL